ncbi:PREDICTED: beta,beta-carotene 15,15'-monooxygenase-like [Cyprinodon variegatus]|uniref:beta,beta-carotene 15,15'-monooxygenase-like n=1 Tax=Cyprinodon variegatus TaxID=28743 RepID=UPI000742C662|nr:PREDICTED: beta,beta-carotene 15,15'-monooxygenase-like [Cyprinodon variegatus]
MQSIISRNGLETPEPVKAEVKGSVPSWLQGTLLRNGPGLFSVGNSEYNHWFDGLSLIHSFTFSGGEVTYRSKYLKSETYKRNIKADRIVVSEFGTMVYPDPCKNIFARAMTHFRNIIPDFTDNNLINIIRYGKDYYASSEVNYINQVDPNSLETVSRENYRNHIAVNLATAHPHYDREGNTYNMGTAIIGLGRPKYVIFKTFFHVIDIKTRKATSFKYYTDALVVFHHINAYEEDGHVVFDIITYKDSNLYNMFYLHNMTDETDNFINANKEFSPPFCQRFILPLSIQKDSPKGTNLVTLTDATAQAVMQDDGSIYCKPDTVFKGMELPGINYNFNARKYRYFYGSRLEWSPHPNKIAKVDIVTRTHIEWQQENCYPSEPVFVGSPGAVEEDDGVILSSVVSSDPNVSPFLLVLNARTFEEIARASVPVPVHMDLHGMFIPSTGSQESS